MCVADVLPSLWMCDTDFDVIIVWILGGAPGGFAKFELRMTFSMWEENNRNSLRKSMILGGATGRIRKI